MSSASPHVAQILKAPKRRLKNEYLEAGSIDGDSRLCCIRLQVLREKSGFEMINLEFDSIVFQEGNTYVAYSPKLDVSSCGGTVNEALNNLKTAVRLFLEEAEKMGTLEDILSESGYEKAGVGDWLTPRLIATELMSVHN